MEGASARPSTPAAPRSSSNAPAPLVLIEIGCRGNPCATASGPGSSPPHRPRETRLRPLAAGRPHRSHDCICVLARAARASALATSSCMHLRRVASRSYLLLDVGGATPDHGPRHTVAVSSRQSALEQELSTGADHHGGELAVLVERFRRENQLGSRIIACLPFFPRFCDY